MRLPQSSLQNAVVVAAHPDDEILWFSSVLDEAARIVICFSDSGHAPQIGAARKRSLEEHAYADKITNLDLEQVKSHNQSRWPEPEETEYGLRLAKSPGFDDAYAEQGERLAEVLKPIIKNASNLFTHNPWGEYGHEDHVQVCRIASKLATKNDTAIWYSGYASNKSIRLMQRYTSGFDNDYFTMPVDTTTAREIAETYFRNDAWTFIDDYVWFDSECFVRGPLTAQVGQSTGRILPVNFIRVPFDPFRKTRKPGFARRLLRRLSGGLRPKHKGKPHAGSD